MTRSEEHLLFRIELLVIFVNWFRGQISWVHVDNPFFEFVVGSKTDQRSKSEAENRAI